MKKSIFASMGMLAISIIAFVSCNKDDVWDDQYDLDVKYRTPMTRSSTADSSESGASQTISGNQQNSFQIPQYENECMLYAIVNIANLNKIPINQTNGKDPQIISQNYSATSAYADIKSRATSRTWQPCDVNGNPIEGEEPYLYSGGEMAPSVAASIGKDAGILKGEIMHFNSYEQMHAVMSTASFQKDHPKGTYIINSDAGRHATVGKGFDRHGNIKYSDAGHNSENYKDSEKVGEWTIIF